jgi:hypothetical protein
LGHPAKRVAHAATNRRCAPSPYISHYFWHLLKIMLKANGRCGVPQGGVNSPLLSNLYLTEVDRMLERGKEATHYGKYPKPNLFLSAFRFEDITYSAAGNSFAFHGIAPEDDFGD